MPTYLFKLEKYNIIEETEIEDEGLAPQTLMNMDKHGNGSLAINAIDGERAEAFCQLHMSIHKNWDNPGFAL
ncbi:MAG: hypothetical protein K0Q79_2813 [Flavipsychrobacter sp.]|jgi:hypothetical protein|nr:hypothetical protein [Flavipsychrobacter sp.]